VRRKWKKILCLGAASSLSLLCANLRAKTCVEIIPEAFITLSLSRWCSRFNDFIRVYFITLKNGGAAAAAENPILRFLSRPTQFFHQRGPFRD
jgi:hypothetical protein